MSRGWSVAQSPDLAEYGLITTASGGSTGARIAYRPATWNANPFLANTCFFGPIDNCLDRIGFFYNLSSPAGNLFVYGYDIRYPTLACDGFGAFTATVVASPEQATSANGNGNIILFPIALIDTDADRFGVLDPLAALTDTFFIAEDRHFDRVFAIDQNFIAAQEPTEQTGGSRCREHERADECNCQNETDFFHAFSPC